MTITSKELIIFAGVVLIILSVNAIYKQLKK